MRSKIETNRKNPNFSFNLSKLKQKLLKNYWIPSKTRTEGVEQQKNEERSDLVGQIDELTNLVSDEKRKRQEAEGNHESLVRDLEIARAEVTTLEEKLAQWSLFFLIFIFI